MVILLLRIILLYGKYNLTNAAEAVNAAKSLLTMPQNNISGSVQTKVRWHTLIVYRLVSGSQHHCGHASGIAVGAASAISPHRQSPSSADRLQQGQRAVHSFR